MRMIMQMLKETRWHKSIKSIAWIAKKSYSHYHLHAPGGGQAAIVCAVSGVAGGDHGVDQVVQLEAGPSEGDLPPGGGDLAHGVSDGLQRRVLRLK